MEDNNSDSGAIDQTKGQVLVRLARQAIAEKLQIPVENIDPDEVSNETFFVKRGVFVTLHKAGELRGCIGSLTGSQPILSGVQHYARCAAFEDHRFSPLQSNEFDNIDIEVSVLTEPINLEYSDGDDLVKNLRPGIDGVIIKKGYASATFLPQVWSQLPDPEGFLLHLCAKAGLPVDSWRTGELEVSTYQVQYFSEKTMDSL